MRNTVRSPRWADLEDLRNLAGHRGVAALFFVETRTAQTRSCRPHVLVDEPAEEISPFDVGHAVGLFDGSETLGHLQFQSSMRASPVVV